jgi:hypothetical protein
MRAGSLLYYWSRQGARVAKDKKAKKNKKAGKGALKGKGLSALAQNPLLADIVAAALVATASALKDSKRARALANEAGDELAKLSKVGSERGSALWEMALQIGRRSLDALGAEGTKKPPKEKAAGKAKSGTSKSSKKKTPRPGK